MRTILNSQTYPARGERRRNRRSPPTRTAISRSRGPHADGGADPGRLSAATGVPEPFKGYPTGTRAVEVAEGASTIRSCRRSPSRCATSCECAREEDPSLPQMLHLLNNADVLAKVESPKSRLAEWLHEGKGVAEVAEKMYLATLSRRPTAHEKDLVLKYLSTAKDRAAAFQDVQHALLNVNEFLLRH